MKRTYLQFAVFYFVQGAVQSYLSNFQKPYLDQSGVSMAQIALISAAMVGPFWIKSLFGWISDRVRLFGDHRKSYMLLGLAMAGTANVVMIFQNPQSSFPAFFTLVLIASTGMAIFDTCADGLAVDTTQSTEVGSVQASMMIGRGVGYLILALAFGWLAQTIGYASVFLTLAVLIFAVAVFVIFTVEPEPSREDFLRDSSWKTLHVIFREHRLLIWLALYSILYSIPSFGVDGITTLLGKKELGFQPDVIGVMGSAQGLGTLFGAAAGAYLLLRRSLATCSLLAVIGITIGAGLFSLSSSAASAHGFSFAWGALWALQETVILVLCMRASKGLYAATAFATLMMFSNVGTSAGEWIATTAADSMGISRTIQILALANLLLIPLAWWIAQQVSRFETRQR